MGGGRSGGWEPGHACIDLSLTTAGSLPHPVLSDPCGLMELQVSSGHCGHCVPQDTIPTPVPMITAPFPFPLLSRSTQSCCCATHGCAGAPGGPELSAGLHSYPSAALPPLECHSSPSVSDGLSSIKFSFSHCSVLMVMVRKWGFSIRLVSTVTGWDTENSCAAISFTRAFLSY